MCITILYYYSVYILDSIYYKYYAHTYLMSKVSVTIWLVITSDHIATTLQPESDDHFANKAKIGAENNGQHSLTGCKP